MTPAPATSPRRWLDWPLALCLLATAWLALLLALPPRAIWISDEGNRLLATKAFAQGSGLDIPDKASALAPELSSFPPPYFVKSSEGFARSGYSPLFPALCAPVFKAAGVWGLRAIPLLTGLLCAALAAFLAKELGGGPLARALSALACGLCSPLAFYSQILLETTSAAALAGLAALLAAKSVQDRKARLWMPALAGLLAGLVCSFREEGYVAAAALLASLALFMEPSLRLRSCLAFAFACLLALLPLWAFNLLESGSLFGLHAKIYASLNGAHSLTQRLEAVPRNLWFFLLKPQFDSPLAGQLAVSLPFVLALGAGFAKNQTFKICALGACLLAALANLSSQIFSPAPVREMLTHQSLAASLPLTAIALAFLRELWEGGSCSRLLLASSGLYILGAGALLDASSSGIFWGARHFLPIAPALCALALVAVVPLQVKSPLKRLCSGILAISLLLQLCSLYSLWEKKAFSAKLLAAEARPGAIVATDVFWLPEEFALAPEETTVVHLNGAEDLRRFVETCQKRGEPFTLLLSRNYRLFPNESATWLLSRCALTPGPLFRRDKLDFLELQAFFCVPKPYDKSQSLR